MGKNLKGKNIGKGYSQRKDGRYEARAVVNGIKINLYDMSLPNLRLRFEEEKAKLLRDEKGIRPNVTVGEWYKEWFEKCKSPQLKNEACRSIYDRKIRNTYIRILGDKKLSDLTQIDIQTACNQLTEENYSIKHIRESTSVLRDCIEIAVVNKVVPINVCKGIYFHNGNEMPKERRVLCEWERSAFLDETAKRYYREVYRFLLLTGVRIGELTALQWQDIDFDKKVVKIQRSMETAYENGVKILEFTTPKTANSYRTIPFFDGLEKELKSWKKKQDAYKKKLGKRWRCDDKFGDLVFTTTMGSPVTRYVIAHDLNKVEKSIRLKEETNAAIEGRLPRYFQHVHPHVFRHTFATMCFEKNMNPVIVQSLMGHANYSTTLSYTHVLDNQTVTEVNKIRSLISV